MPKRKANWWPPSILSDPDVLSVDDEGRYVLCKICHVHYAVHGGKKPKPVIMNSNFRTRAWDVHKERTNSHRLQKQQERLQHNKQDEFTETAKKKEQQPATERMSKLPRQVQHSAADQAQSQAETQSMCRLASQTLSLSQASPLQTSISTTLEQTSQASIRPHSETQVLQHKDQQQQQERQGLEEKTKEAEHNRLQATSHVEKSTDATLQTATQTNTIGMHHGRLTTSSSKRPTPSMPVTAPMPKRRAYRIGLSGSRQLVAESTSHPYGRHSLIGQGNAVHARKLPTSEHALTMKEQADSSARWRHMHDDVSRALSPTPRRRQQEPASYTTGELRAAKTLAQTETGDLGGNNSERVAKKLRSLNAEYHASNMRYTDAYNMRLTDVLDRRNPTYKEYWGTLRNVYTSSGTAGGGTNTSVPYRKSYYHDNPSVMSTQECKDTEADSTTPDESGSSEDAFKPTVVVHDASLINAIERLTDVTSRKIAILHEKEASDTREALAGLTSVMTDLRVQHGHALERMIELQEKHLKVLESILDFELRKEAAHNARNNTEYIKSISWGSSGSATGSSGGGGLSSQSPEAGQENN
ncbi:hypothetical protein PsorP6_004647 [Peronosclerospora sorghi]|uniref:Uncharacterized protein n=1 Tax=Peronosclerospora sorghi TaxID=230839 RepID=A0ACC0VNE4_9STRA|nr:hypothetical protein PsorP6_004647 [Peronosclerospora sorghi]